LGIQVLSWLARASSESPVVEDQCGEARLGEHTGVPRLYEFFDVTPPSCHHDDRMWASALRAEEQRLELYAFAVEVNDFRHSRTPCG
jgi:hypothetical protein